MLAFDVVVCTVYILCTVLIFLCSYVMHTFKCIGMIIYPSLLPSPSLTLLPSPSLPHSPSLSLPHSPSLSLPLSLPLPPPTDIIDSSGSLPLIKEAESYESLLSLSEDTDHSSPLSSRLHPSLSDPLIPPSWLTTPTTSGTDLLNEVPPTQIITIVTTLLL